MLQRSLPLPELPPAPLLDDRSISRAKSQHKWSGEVLDLIKDKQNKVDGQPTRLLLNIYNQKLSRKVDPGAEGSHPNKSHDLLLSSQTRAYFQI